MQQPYAAGFMPVSSSVTAKRPIGVGDEGAPTAISIRRVITPSRQTRSRRAERSTSIATGSRRNRVWLSRTNPCTPFGRAVEMTSSQWPRNETTGSVVVEPNSVRLLTTARTRAEPGAAWSETLLPRNRATTLP